MKSLLFKSPPTQCAFHDHNTITHFCRTAECLLPLCRDCLPIHRKEHASKSAPIDLLPIDDQAYSVHRSIAQQVAVLDDAFSTIAEAINASNQLHAQLRIAIYSQRDSLTQAIALYYESLLREVELNFQRRHAWLQDVSRQYQGVRQEMAGLQERLQGEKHLRTIIMWNRLRPEEHVAQIQRQAGRELQPPSLVSCDPQRVINFMSQCQSMVVLDLQGDLGFTQLAKVLYTLRYGPEESNVSSINPNRTLGITLISKGRPSPAQRLTLSKSSERF